MGRSRRIERRGFRLAAAAALVAVGFVSCDNPFDISEVVNQEVLAAEGLYLQITSVTPADGADDINPGKEMVIGFDRELDIETVTQATVRLEKFDDSSGEWVEQTWTSSRYDPATYTLYISGTQGDPILEIDTRYKITISNLADSAGYGLPASLEQTFETGTYPVGFVTSVESRGSAGDNGASEEGYTDVLDVDVAMQINYQTTHYLLTDDFSKVSDASYYADPANASQWVAVDPLVSTQPTGTFDSFSDSSEGTKVVYALFRDASDPDDIRYSVPMSGEIIYDTVPPPAPVVTGDSLTVDLTPTWTYSSAGGDGTGLFRAKVSTASDWNSVDGTSSLSFTASSSAITDNSDNIVWVQERDPAGNWSASGTHTTEVVSVLPRDGSSLFPFLTSATLQWRRPTSISFFLQTQYYVQVSSSASFAAAPSTPPSSAITETSTEIPVSDGNEYFWRVAVYTRNISIFGSDWTFHSYYPSSLGASFEVGYSFQL